MRVSITLYVLIRYGDAYDIKLLQDGYTALMLAIIKGHTEIVSMLLAVEGIDVNTKDKVSKCIYECYAVWLCCFDVLV